jgi:hypothetical protein
MATYRTILNRVLRTLREDEVDASETTLTDDYHKLVGTFVNQIKEEVEEAHMWRDLQQQHTATVLASTQSATIISATDRSRVVHAKSESGPVALVFDVTTATAPFPLQEVPLAELEYRIAQDSPGTATSPVMFAVLAGTDETLQIKVYPKPTVNRSITLQMVTPQARLADDDLDDVVLVPARPIEMGAIWYALEERGEELGTNALFTEERFRAALDNAVAADAEEQGGYELQVV